LASSTGGLGGTVLVTLTCPSTMTYKKAPVLSPVLKVHLSAAPSSVTSSCWVRPLNTSACARLPMRCDLSQAPVEFVDYC
jgi:hypothetical protein